MGRKIIWILAILSGLSGIVILSVFVFILSTNYQINGTILPEETGITGDFIGGVVGTLWSLTGIFLFYLALSYQRDDLNTQKKSIELQTQELKFQGEQLELQKIEMEETRKIVKEQSETMKIQKFETTFFNLIRNHSEVVKNIKYSPRFSSDKLSGYDVIDETYQEMESDVKRLQSVMQKKIISNNLYLKGFEDSLIQYVSRFEDVIEDILLIIEFIENKTISDPYFYFKLLHNSLNPKERILLGFYIEYLYEDILTNEVKNNLQTDYYLYGWGGILKSKDLPPRIALHKFRNIYIDGNHFIKEIKEVKIEFNNSENEKIVLERILINNYPLKKKIDMSFKSNFEINPFESEEFKIEIPTLGTEVGYNISFLMKKESSSIGYEYLCNIKMKMVKENRVVIYQ